MTEKIIIENRTTIPMERVLTYVAAVLSRGRISNNNTQYCYHTSYAGEVGVSAFKNKNSDRFVVTRENER